MAIKTKKFIKSTLIFIVMILSLIVFLTIGAKKSALADKTSLNLKPISPLKSAKDFNYKALINPQKQNHWQLTSPDKTIITDFNLNSNGSLTYTTSKGNQAVIKNSFTGLKTTDGDFTSGLKFINSKTNWVHDKYFLKGSKEDHVNIAGRQLILNFKKDNVNYSLLFRSYNNGIALRYKINKPHANNNLNISSEKTEVNLPSNAVSHGQTYDTSNESPYHSYSNQKLATTSFTMPFLYRTNSNWVLLSEASLNDNYTGSQLKGKNNGKLAFNFAPEQTSNVKTKMPFSSPWRFAVIGSPKTIAGNMMSETLSPASKIKNTNWIKSGTSDWTWLNGDLRSGQDIQNKGFQTYKKYIDFAAKMGWKYQILDEGWQPKNEKASKSIPEFNHISNYDPQSSDYYHGYYNWTGKLLQYAKQRGIKLIAWINSHDLQTTQQRKRIDYLSHLGFSGFKIDFFSSQSQSTLKLIHTLFKQTAQDKAILDLHGIPKPTGEDRTYPQQLTREATMAAEQYGTDDTRDPHNYGGGTKPTEIKMTAVNDCLMPFTRSAIGPTDYDPMASYGANENTSDGPKDKNDNAQPFENLPEFTLAHMAAMPVVIQSGTEVLADKPKVYQNSPAYRHYWQNFPSQWDQTKVLDGIPGLYASIARRSGQNWYVGLISAYKNSVKKEVKLNFLKPNTVYKAYIYKDNKNNPTKKIDTEVKTVTNKDILNLNLVSYHNPVVHYKFGGQSRSNIIASGGAAIKLEEIKPAKVNK